MRAFFSIRHIDDKLASVDILTRTFNISDSVTITFRKEGSQWKYSSTIFIAPNNEVMKVLRYLNTLMVNANTGAMELIDKIREDGGRQVVYDERLTKYRNVTTMKDDDNLYVAVGIDGIEVSAKDEKVAKKRISTKITAMMVDAPTSAVELADWFAKGQKIELVESGEAPSALPLEGLADEGQEVKKAVIKTSKSKRRARKADK